MTFKPERFGECEAAKIAPLVVPYLQGKCLDIGSGAGKVWPSLIGIDTATHGWRPVTDLAMDGTDLSMFADGSIDGVFSSFLLHLLEPSKVLHALKEWARVLKVGGYLVLYLPDKDAIGDHDIGQRWAYGDGTLERALSDINGWEYIERELRVDGEEYGWLHVFRRTQNGWTENFRQHNPDGKKRALVIRLGAIGDAIVAASIFPHLQAQGYHVTLNCHPSTEEVLRHDPHIDEFLVQGKDFVPNDALGPYWAALSERYDTVINLSESVEGLLLTLPGRLNHGYSDAARRALYSGVNYLEHTHNIASVPFGFDNARFHATEAETKWAHAVRRRMSGPVVVWVINGSSMHKVYPFVHIVGRWLLERTAAHLVMFADPGVGKDLQKGVMDCLAADGVDMARVHGIAGKWNIRQSLSFAQVADCVVGPETGPMNAVGMEPMPKVVYLSHSTAENLTKHWRNTTVLQASRDVVPCAQACHRLHYDWTYCKRNDQTMAAACASAILPETIFDAIVNSLACRIAA